MYTGYRGDSRYAPYQTDKLVIKGRRYIVEYHFDEDGGKPWEDDCGRGVVRESVHDHRVGSCSNKKPYERPLNQPGRNGYQYYLDVHATMAKALKDGWGLADDDMAALVKRLGRAPTKRQIAAECVEQEHKFLSGWLNDDWHYVTIQVTDVETEVSDSIGRVESCSKDHINTLIVEMVDGMNAQVIEALLSGGITDDGDEDTDLDAFSELLAA